MGRSVGWLIGVQPYLLLGGLCLLLYLPGMSAIPPLDRDEARFSQATRQMLETGDYLRIRFQDAGRNNKPAGIYWLQAAAVSVFSTPDATAIWPYRVPSLLGGMAAVALTFACGSRVFGARLPRGAVSGAGSEAGPPGSRRIAAIASVLLATSLGVVAEAHIAKTDAVLLAAVAAGQGALGLAYVRARAGRAVSLWIALLFWSAELVAILIKGPPGPVLAVVTAGALSIADRDVRWLRGLRPLAGIAALCVALAPWLTLAERATEGRFLADSLGQDMLAKLIGAQESHGAPPLSYLAMSLATFWPGSLLVVPALVHAWRRRDAPAERFLLAWLVPGWVLLELVPTKLPHYVLPLVPALALLAAAGLADGTRFARATWARRLDWLVRGAWALVSLGLAVLLIGLPLRFGDGLAVTGVLGAVLLITLMAALLWYRPGPWATTGLVAALSLVFVTTAAFGVLPRLDRLWLSRGAAGLVARHPPAAGTPLVAVGYSEPSLVFLLGTSLRLTTSQAAAEMLASGGEALVSSREDAQFHQAIGSRRLRAQSVGGVAGLDYSNGQRMVLTLYEIAAD